MRSNKVSRRLAILCHSGAGGSGVMATELAVLLAELGHQVHLVGERKPFRLGVTSLSVAPEGLEYQDLGEEPLLSRSGGNCFSLPGVDFVSTHPESHRQPPPEEVSIFTRY